MSSQSESGFWVRFEKYRQGKLGFLYAHDNSTLRDRWKLALTKYEMTEVEDNLNKADTFELCCRDRMKTMGRFSKLTNLSVFADLLKHILEVARTMFYPNLCWEAAQPTASRIKKIQDSRLRTTCVFFVLLINISTEINDWKRNFHFFNFFFNGMDGLEWCSISFKTDNRMDDILFVEFLLTLNVLLYDIDFVDGNFIGELARRSVQEHKKLLQPLRYNNLLWNMCNVNVVFLFSRCHKVDTFFNRTFSWEGHLTGCNDCVKKSVRGTYIKSQKLSLRSWTLFVSSTQINRLFKNLRKIDFESIYVQKRPSKRQRQHSG